MKRHFDLVKQVEIKLAKFNDNNEPLSKLITKTY
jgi:hypothetical protein